MAEVKKNHRGRQNLIPLTEKSPEEAFRIRSAGGKASSQLKRDRRDLRLALEGLLFKKYPVNQDGKRRHLSGAELIALKQFQKALKGDTHAFEVVRDTAGQKPVERVENVGISAEDIRIVESYVKDNS